MLSYYKTFLASALASPAQQEAPVLHAFFSVVAGAGAAPDCATIVFGAVVPVEAVAALHDALSAVATLAPVGQHDAFGDADAVVAVVS